MEALSFRSSHMTFTTLSGVRDPRNAYCATVDTNNKLSRRNFDLYSYHGWHWWTSKWETFDVRKIIVPASMHVTIEDKSFYPETVFD